MSRFKFSVGPWNVHTGADSYGPETRKMIDLESKFAKFAELGFSAVQFHDDDAVPDMNNMTEEEIREYARGVKSCWTSTASRPSSSLPACGWTRAPRTAAS